MSRLVRDNMWLWFAVCAALMASMCGFALGTSVGVKRTEQTAAAREQAASLVETRIMQFVLKRNPDATIRDFHDFPRVVLEESEAAGLDFRLVMALIDKESQFNARAVGKAGEIGLMQVMPSTGALVAKGLGIPFEPPKGTNLGTLGVPRLNLHIGIRFLKDRIDEFGGVNATAIRAYNRGPAMAREHRPSDRYAEDIAIGYMVLAQVLPSAAEAKQ